MSWSVQIPPSLAEKVPSVIEGLELPEYARAMNSAEEMGEQLRAAKRAVLLLFFSGALGDPTQGVWVGTISGHANPGHLPTPGWSLDSMALSFSQTDYTPSVREAYAAAGKEMPVADDNTIAVVGAAG